MFFMNFKKEGLLGQKRVLWRVLACFGFLLTSVSIIVNIYVLPNSIYGEIGSFPYAGFIGNVVAALGFLLLIFFPQNFNIYSILFYLYGISNFLNKGNMLAILCIASSFSFMYCSGTLKKINIFASCSLVVFPFLCFFTQIKAGKEFFLVSLCHLCAAVLIFCVLFFLLFPYIRRYFNQKQQKRLCSPDFTEVDVQNLTKIQQGQKYEAIAINMNISTSSVKTMMVRLYRNLGVTTREEFLITYNNTEFVFEDK